jgi:transcription-repair coupling factor (superfamily II helicase)
MKRLRIISDHTELGSGFKIALKDLEIRGAGNILGTRQHGFIAAVGFELYCRLLEEAVRTVKGEPPLPAVRSVTLEIPLHAYIPTEYIADSATRVIIYQDCAGLTDLAGLDEMAQSLVDRFGPLPQPVVALMLLMRIRIMALDLGCSRVAVTDSGELKLFFEGSEEEVKQAVHGVVIGSDRTFEVMYAQPLCLTTKLGAPDPAAGADQTRIILETILKKTRPTREKPRKE